MGPVGSGSPQRRGGRSPGRAHGQDDKMESGEVDLENLSSDSSEHCWPRSDEDGFSSDSSVRGPRGKPQTHMQPASKRSRSTQVSEEFVRRQQAADPPKVAHRSRSTQVSDEFVKSQQAGDPPHVAPPDDLCKDQIWIRLSGCWSSWLKLASQH